MKQGQPADIQRKYVLHFDVHKTIQLMDAKFPTQTKEECVHQLQFIGRASYKKSWSVTLGVSSSRRTRSLQLCGN